jgi:hypothetical protein
MLNKTSPFSPSPFGRGRRRTEPVEVLREIKTAFIPYGTNAARCRVRGATQLRLVLTRNPVVMQRGQPHSFQAQPFGLCSSSITGAARLGYLLNVAATLVAHASMAAPVLASAARETVATLRFTLRLGGPFAAIVSGRAFTVRLLSGPSFNNYSSSSQPFPAARDDNDFR